MNSITIFSKPVIFNYTNPANQVVGAVSGVTTATVDAFGNAVRTNSRAGVFISCTGGDCTVRHNGATVPGWTIGADETGQYIPFDEGSVLILNGTATVTCLEYKN